MWTVPTKWTPPQYPEKSKRDGYDLSRGYPLNYPDYPWCGFRLKSEEQEDKHNG